ncbi:MAG: cytochrome c biogenesis protein CcsA, partial [Pseudomonadota bacterium]
MIVELGHFALILSVAVAAFQMGGPLIGHLVNDERLMLTARPSAVTQCALLTISFGALTYAYVASDFSVSNVYLNSHSDKPLLYRVTGVWGNHEGSMLLWVLMLAVFGLAVALFGTNLPTRLRANVLAVQGAIGLAFGLFIVFTSNPFLRMDPAPFEGSGLNPILQDPGLAFHPPFLYAGYVGFANENAIEK